MIHSVPGFGLTAPTYITQPNSNLIPQEFKFFPEISSLNSITLHNFKSFRDEKYVGPFTQFTAIIGANGSGKSNVLEAILFCLGADKLKGAHFQPKENFYKNENQTQKEVQKNGGQCWVEMHFGLKFGDRSLVLRRTINLKNESVYCVNDQTVMKQAYVALLSLKGIIANQVCNIAVSQNTLDSLIHKDPVDLRQQFQIYSGSIYIQQQLLQLQKSLETIDNETRLQKQNLGKLKFEKKSITAQRNANLIFNQLTSRISRLKEKLVLSKMLSKQIELRDLDKEIETVQAEENEKLAELNKKKGEAQRNFKESMGLKQEIERMKGEIAEINRNLKEIGDENLGFKEGKVKDLKEQLKREVVDLETYEYKKETLTQKLPEVQSGEIITQYLEIYANWERSNLLLKDIFEKKQLDIAMLDRLIEGKTQSIQSYKEAQKKFDVNKQEHKNKLKEAEENVDKAEGDLNDAKEKFKKFVKEYNEVEVKLKKHYVELEEWNGVVENLEWRLNEGIMSLKENEITRKLQDVDGYIGFLSDKVKASRSQYARAIGSIFAYLQRHILVEDNQASIQIAGKLKELKKCRNLIILNNAKGSEADLSSLRDMVHPEGIPAFDAMSLDNSIPNFRNYISHLLKSKVIVKTIDDAIALRNKKIPGVRQIYTMEGDLIKTNGMISSTGYSEGRKYEKFDAAVQKSLLSEIKNAKSNCEKVTQKINNIKGDFKEELKFRKEQEIKSLLAKKLEAESNLNRWRNYKPNTKKQQDFRVKEKELEELIDQRADLNKNIKSTEREIQKSGEFRQFMKKHKIENLECFRNANNIEELQRKFDLRNQILKEIAGINKQIERIEGNCTKYNLDVAEKELRKVTDNAHKKELLGNLSKRTKEMEEKKAKIALLKTGFNEVFVSKIPEIKERREALKRNSKGYLRELNTQHSTNIEIVDFDGIFKDTSSTMDRLTLSRLNQYMEKNLKELKESEDEKEKLISFKVNLDYGDDEANDEDTKVVNINQRINEKTREVEALHDQKEQRKEEVYQKRNERKVMFLKFLHAFKVALQDVYKFLTSDPNNPMRQGEVDIFVEDEASPFTGGLYFVPTPPTKRLVYDIGQLSGGEKSMASLAYNYAMALTTKSPFLILDEVDAHLDATNTMKMKSLLQRSKKDLEMQIVMITHSQLLFPSCLSLVGIQNDRVEKTSKAFSMKLES